MNIKEFKKLKLPDSPGVYFWKNGSNVLYIGKATFLRDRVKSYFSNDLISTRGPRILDMVTKSKTIEWQETDSILEALILEANLIKKYEPFYNIKEKDDRSWNYVVITREKFPRVLIVRGRALKLGRIHDSRFKIQAWYGPFTNSNALREALRIIRKMFPFIDKNSFGKDKYHFYRQLGLTPDTATEEARKEYLTHIKHIKMFFQGKKNVVVRSLKNQMKKCVKKMEFEKANEIKKQIFGLEHIRDVSLIKDDLNENSIHNFASIPRGFRIEGYDIAHMSGKETVGVMTVMIDGELEKNEYRKLKLAKETGNNDTINLEEIITRRFSHTEWKFPDIAVVDGGVAQKNIAEKLISELSPITIIVSVVKDYKHKARQILGAPEIVSKHQKQILLINSEAHRFAITYHRKLSQMSHRHLAGLK